LKCWYYIITSYFSKHVLRGRFKIGSMYLSVLKGLRQEGHKFKAILVYILSSKKHVSVCRPLRFKHRLLFSLDYLLGDTLSLCFPGWSWAPELKYFSCLILLSGGTIGTHHCSQLAYYSLIIISKLYFQINQLDCPGKSSLFLFCFVILLILIFVFLSVLWWKGAVSRPNCRIGLWDLAGIQLLLLLLFPQPSPRRPLSFHKEAPVCHCGLIQQCRLQGKFHMSSAHAGTIPTVPTLIVCLFILLHFT
jgi:hypothetical protein